MENSLTSQKEVGRRKYHDRRRRITLFPLISARKMRRQLFSIKSIENFRDDALWLRIFRTFGNNPEQLSYGFVGHMKFWKTSIYFSNFSIFDISKGRMIFGCVRVEGPKYPLQSCKIIFNVVVTLEISESLVSKNDQIFEKFAKNRQI